MERTVILEGGLPWGFRIQGGVDTGIALRIARVNPGSKASLQGIREGDVITSINGNNSEQLTNAEAHQLLKEPGSNLKLTLTQGNTLSRKVFKTSVTVESKTKHANRPNGSHGNPAGATTVGQSNSDSTSFQGCNNNLQQKVNLSDCCVTPEHEAVTSFCSTANAGDASQEDWHPVRDSRNEGQDSSLLNEIEAALGTTLNLSYQGVWSPSQSQSQSNRNELAKNDSTGEEKKAEDKTETTPVWTPPTVRSPSLERKEFRPVRLDTSTLKKQPSQEREKVTSLTTQAYHEETNYHWLAPDASSTAATTPASETSRLFDSSRPTSTTPGTPSIASSFTLQSSWSQRGPSSSTLSTPAVTPTSHLPRAPNATVTLLQKAREGQLPKGAAYLESNEDKIYRSPQEKLYTIKREYESEDEQRRKIVELTPKKFTGIGPTSQEGIPLALRTGVQEENQHQWYRRMYDSLHRAGKQGRYPYGGGYQSEPEPCDYNYDSDASYNAGRYSTLDRRRNTPTSGSRTGYQDIYRNQPGRIEDFEPGHSSISEKENKQAAKAVRPTRSFTSFALKESGYESDSQLVFRRKSEQDTSSTATPLEQRAWYRDIQKGGDVPLHGLRKPAPDRPQEPSSQYATGSYGADWNATPQGASHRFAESQVNIHYKSPIRNLQTNSQEEDEEEMRLRQAEHMRRVYEQERRRKYLQELQDIEMRRHTDNFTPLQKSPIPLNRYDDFMEEQSRAVSRDRERTPEPKVVARALYNFVALNARELSFQKGDIIFVRRQIDKNWYEGEHNALVGIFPVNYVEIVPYDSVRVSAKKPTEGQARAKYNFMAQSPMELSLVKGELVVITRQIDDRWLEGRIGNRKGIFPANYVDIIAVPSEKTMVTASKPVSHPASHSLITNGTLRNYRTPYSVQSQPNHDPMPRMGAGRGIRATPPLPPTAMSTSLHIDTHTEPVMYRALYSYKPQNDDELELEESDIVSVLEKCDDGWYVGTSQRTGQFGTFPGNYVERV